MAVGWKHIENMGTSLKAAAENWFTSKLWYNICPRRFTDSLKDTLNQITSFSDSLMKILTEDTILSVFNKVLGNCVSKGIIEDSLQNLSDLDINQKKTFQNLVATRRPIFIKPIYIRK